MCRPVLGIEYCVQELGGCSGCHTRLLQKRILLLTGCCSGSCWDLNVVGDVWQGAHAHAVGSMIYTVASMLCMYLAHYLQHGACNMGHHSEELGQPQVVTEGGVCMGGVRPGNCSTCLHLATRPYLSLQDVWMGSLSSHDSENTKPHASCDCAGSGEAEGQVAQGAG